MLDLLDVDRVGVVGMSVGAAYAAALAARHPDRVMALAIVAAPRETRTAMGALAARWLASLPPDDGALLGAELTVTPTTHLATLLANWQTILAALRSYLD